MCEKTKIYQVHKGKVIETEVRETAKMFFIDEPRWDYDYRSKIYKDDAFLSPMDAITHHKNKALALVDLHRNGLKEGREFLQQIRELETIYKEA